MLNAVLTFAKKAIFAFAVGAAFSLATPARAGESILFDFAGKTGGAYPVNGVAADAHGSLYGAAVLAGPGNCAVKIYSCGVVYRLDPPAGGVGPWTETVLHVFSKVFRGTGPTAVSFGPDGALYGVAQWEGACIQCGVVFRVGPPPAGSSTWSYTVLHEFTGGPDGSSPQDLLSFDASGAIYGVTTSGGGAAACGSCGIAFKLERPLGGGLPWTETILHVFGATGALEGIYPSGPLLLDSAGALYGVAAEGGAGRKGGAGTVYKLSPPATVGAPWTETTLHRFGPGQEGINPRGRLLMDASGSLYGSTTDGGPGHFGTVYQLAPPSAGQNLWPLSVLHAFSGLLDDGAPFGGVLMDASGAIYGAFGGSTRTGNSANQGIFKLTPPATQGAPWAEASLYDFGKVANDLLYPFSDSIRIDSTGAIVGTAAYGGADGSGGVFRITP